MGMGQFVGIDNMRLWAASSIEGDSSSLLSGMQLIYYTDLVYCSQVADFKLQTTMAAPLPPSPSPSPPSPPPATPPPSPPQSE